jgi:outer membrane biosynthesis protein TonB
MRMSKIHKIVVAAVVTTIATATLLTFTRSDSASADRVASLPEKANDSPVVVASRTPGPTTRPTPTPKATTPSPKSDPATRAPVRTTTKSVEPSTKPTRPPAPTTGPTPSPTPTREKSLVEILLGQ